MTNARAVRPVNARVVAVRSKRGSVSAARCVGDVPASGQPRNAVPIAAQVAPASSTRRASAPSISPPAATRGNDVSARTPVSSAASGSPGVAESSSVKPPRCAPASLPCSHSPSTPTAAASDASATDVTVTSTAEPAACNRCTVSADGQPKATLTTGTPATAASLASTSSSSQRGSPSSTPSSAASGRSRSR